jgi:hypothetical protein
MTRKQPTVRDTFDLFERIHQANKPRAVGDKVLAYRGNAVATIVRIDGCLVYLDNGDAMHISKVRSAPEGK